MQSSSVKSPASLSPLITVSFPDCTVNEMSFIKGLSTGAHERFFTVNEWYVSFDAVSVLTAAFVLSAASVVRPSASELSFSSIKEMSPMINFSISFTTSSLNSFVLKFNPA